MSVTRSVVVILATMLGVEAQASNWVDVVAANDGTRLQIDLSTIKMKSGWVQAWIKADFSRVRIKKEHELVELINANCNARTVRIVSATYYDRNGNALTSENGSTGDMPVAPDTVNEAIWSAGCKLGVQQAAQDTLPN